MGTPWTLEYRSGSFIIDYQLSLIKFYCIGDDSRALVSSLFKLTVSPRGAPVPNDIWLVPQAIDAWAGLR